MNVKDYVISPVACGFAHFWAGHVSICFGVLDLGVKFLLGVETLNIRNVPPNP